MVEEVQYEVTKIKQKSKIILVCLYSHVVKALILLRMVFH